MDRLAVQLRFFLISLLAVSAVACQSPDSLSGPVDQRRYITDAMWDYHFDSLLQMVATSTAVIRGTVESAGKGRLIGDPDDGSQERRLREVIVRVDEQLFGEQVGTRVVLEEEGFDSKGNPFEIEGAPWSEIGDHGIFFLEHRDTQAPGHFYWLPPEGRLLLRDGEVTSSSTSALGKSLERLTIRELKEAIRDAGRIVEDRNIPPLKPLHYLRRD